MTRTAVGEEIGETGREARAFMSTRKVCLACKRLTTLGMSMTIINCEKEIEQSSSQPY